MKGYWIAGFILVFALLVSSPPLSSEPTFPLAVQDGAQYIHRENAPYLAASPEKQVNAVQYVIIEAPGTNIPARGALLADILRMRGLPILLLSADAINESSLKGAECIILDGSMGAGNGSLVSDLTLSSLLQTDAPLVLLGRSSWLVHRLRGRGTPSMTAFSTTIVYTTPRYEKAVFFSSPSVVALGNPVTDESAVPLPVDRVQTEHSRLVNLTGTDDVHRLPVLRYDSWPLDLFLFSPEDPASLTTNGINLLVNVLAYATALRETETANVISSHQADPAGPVGGGMSYFHEPTLEAIYHAVHIAHNVLDAANWTQWRDNHEQMITNALNVLYQSTGSLASFYTSAIDGKITNTSTAQGLWIVSIMNLQGFNTTALIASLSSAQQTDGGFQNSIDVTYYVTEALATADALNTIDTGSLESWLRACVIDSSDTMDALLWGGVSLHPESASPSNQYASHYVLSLRFLGATHNDPAKLTEWIVEQTRNSDGSFNNTMNQSSDTVIGTAGALTTLSILGTLNSSDRSAGLSWLSSVRSDAGGFGRDGSDRLGKLRFTGPVALCLTEINGDTSGLIEFVKACETPLGYENMEVIPSLMWTARLTEAARYAHSFFRINTTSLNAYLEQFAKWSEYPALSTIKTLVPPEYMSYRSSTQYFDLSVWSQLFAVMTIQSLGLDLNDDQSFMVVSQLQQCQSFSGHYYPMNSILWQPAMQYSVAAIEALYRIGELDSIKYRSQLETAVLNEYNNGTWSADSWTILPYAKDQSAIDWLSTRAALRLGLITDAMASEIASTISSRIQYDDLWALSHDVSTLALLNSSFDVSLEIINITRVEAELHDYFLNGWFNSSLRWQPVYTADVLEMESILGLRTRLADPLGQTLTVTSVGASVIGHQLPVTLSINSTDTMHTVLVHAFGKFMEFENVSNTDTIYLTVPGTADVLGPSNISLMLADYGQCRAFARAEVTTTGALSGVLEPQTNFALVGDVLNITVQWTLDTGGSAGQTDIEVLFGNASFVEKWYYYNKTSPFDFQVPTSDYTNGTYMLNVTLSRDWCESLTMSDDIVLANPEPTYFVADSIIHAEVTTPVLINWSLHFQSNDSYVASQIVRLEVLNGSDTIHSDTAVSVNGDETFIWTPSARGTFTYRLVFERNGTIEATSFTGNIIVAEATQLTWQNTGTHDQYSNVTVDLILSTTSGERLPDETVQVTVQSPTGLIVFNASLVTNGSGCVSLMISLDENGVYSLSADFAGTPHLKYSSATDNITAWSATGLDLFGPPTETLVSESYSIVARLFDSQNQSLKNEPLTLTIIYLPSTVLVNQTFTTDADGMITYSWTPDSSGNYAITVVFSATYSLGDASATRKTSTYIPLTLTITTSETLEVGLGSWIDVLATDHLGDSVSSIFLNITTTGFAVSGTTDASGHLNVTWTPEMRGIIRIDAASSRQLWYEAATSSLSVAVYENITLLIHLTHPLLAIGSTSLTVQLLDSSGHPVNGLTVSTDVYLNGATLLDLQNTTNVNGIIEYNLTLNMPGHLTVVASFDSQDYLKPLVNQTADTVFGISTITINPTSPLMQTSSRGIIVTLSDWSGSPLKDATILFSISDMNGRLVYEDVLTTGSEGTCAVAYTFNEIGDFLINATFAGKGLNSHASQLQIQQIYVTPSIELHANASVLVNEPLVIQVGLYDLLGNYISERNLTLSIVMGTATVFETSLVTGSGLTTIHWTPQYRGSVQIQVHHTPDFHYLENSTETSSSVLELVNGQVLISDDTIDLFESTQFEYHLDTTGVHSNVNIEFKILGPDLLPIWIAKVPTDENGTAHVVYFANQTYGPLILRAEPSADQFMIGGSVQAQLTVMTNCTLDAMFQPTPAALGGAVTIIVNGRDDLNGPISDVVIRLSLYDPYGAQIKLGKWSNSVDLTLQDGSANVTFTPSVKGLYSLQIQSSSTSTVHAASLETTQTIYSPTNMVLSISSTDLWVGDTLHIVAQLIAYGNEPLSGLTVQLEIDGPGSAIIGPVSLITNASGYVTWDSSINDQGLWLVRASFAGAGVYLPHESSQQVDVRFGTVFDVIVPSSEIIANQTDATFLVLLKDSQDAPLEGFTFYCQIYREGYGLLEQRAVVQAGNGHEAVEITFPLMGNYSVIFTFDGTDHYHPSNTAVTVFVLGTTTIHADGPRTLDTASNATIDFSVYDEAGTVISMDQLPLHIQLENDSGLIDLTDRILWMDNYSSLIPHGLAIGPYRLTIIVDNSSIRIGTFSTFMFNITTQTGLDIADLNIDGIIGHEQSITLSLHDSMARPLDSAVVLVSLFNPSGQEILGSSLTKVSEFVTTNGTIEIAWSPNLVGNYSLIVSYPGSDFVLGSEFQYIILVRHQTKMEVSVDWLFEYGDPIEMQVTLTSGIKALSNTEVVVLAFLGNQPVGHMNAVTNLRGTATVKFTDLPAGIVTLNITYSGDTVYAPVFQTRTIKIKPSITIKITEVFSPYVNSNCSVQFNITVGGVDSSWQGLFIVDLHGPQSHHVSRSFVIGPIDSVVFTFFASDSGAYSVNVTIDDLPAVESYSDSFVVAVELPPPPMVVDASTTPVITGGLVIPLLGLIVRRRINKLVESLPSDWEE